MTASKVLLYSKNPDSGVSSTDICKAQKTQFAALTFLQQKKSESKILTI